MADAVDGRVRGVRILTREILGLVVLLVAMLAWAALAPAEKTLGDGIRIVYLHVAATWAALVGIYAAGLLGILLAVRPGETLERGLGAVGLTALTFFGTGLGLSIVRSIIESQGGTIEVHRLDAGGTAFVVALPVYAG